MHTTAEDHTVSHAVVDFWTDFAAEGSLDGNATNHATNSLSLNLQPSSYDHDFNQTSAIPLEQPVRWRSFNTLNHSSHLKNTYHWLQLSNDGNFVEEKVGGLYDDKCDFWDSIGYNF